MFQDYLFYGTDVETRYAFRMLHLTSLVRQAQAMHGLKGAEAELLGRGLLSGVLLASILEDEERINLRFHSGDDCTMGVETTRHAVTRGYLETNGESALISQLKENQEPILPWVVRSLRSRSGTSQLFEGISGTETDSLEVAVNAHLENSYQMKTQVRIDCWHNPKDGQLYAAGVIYLELPNLKPEVSQQLWSHVEKLPRFRDLFGETGHDPDQVSAKLIPHQVRAINSINPSWGCTCSSSSIETMLKKLGHAELFDMVDEAKPAEIRCHYCNKNFYVEVSRLKELAEELITGENASSSKILN
jgi:molecular chaperone Hsp33